MGGTSPSPGRPGKGPSGLGKPSAPSRRTPGPSFRAPLFALLSRTAEGPRWSGKRGGRELRPNLPFTRKSPRWPLCPPQCPWLSAPVTWPLWLPTPTSVPSGAPCDTAEEPASCGDTRNSRGRPPTSGGCKRRRTTVRYTSHLSQ